MTIRSRFLFVTSLFVLPLACSSDPGAEGTGGSTSSDGSGGTLGTGGSSSGSGSGSGTGSGSTGSGASSSGTGGDTASGGTSNGDGGSDAAGGSGGGTGGGGSTVNGSEGCGKAGRPSGGKVYVSGVSWLVFPESYDGTTPFPVLFGFHGCGSGNRGDASRSEYTDLTANNAFGTGYVRAIPLSTGTDGCWNYDNDIGRVKALYDELTENYCVDVDRVFATGHSSGAAFAESILTTGHVADAEHLGFAAMAPVASYNVGTHGTAMPVMYIQNPNDNQRSAGNDVAVMNLFRAGNGCESTSTAYPVNTCQSGSTTVNPGCISYNGCDAPTLWCSHNDPAYSGTGHGVPCFAMSAMHTFFETF